MIKGGNWSAERLERTVEKFIKESLTIETKVKKASRSGISGGKDIILVELEGWETKREIMRRKKDLRKDIFVEDDLTRKEREIQRELRRRASAERKKGDINVKVGYKKIYMKDRWYRWTEMEEMLEEERRGARE